MKIVAIQLMLLSLAIVCSASTNYLCENPLPLSPPPCQSLCTTYQWSCPAGNAGKCVCTGINPINSALNIECTEEDQQSWLLCVALCAGFNPINKFGLPANATEISSADCAGGFCNCYYEVSL